MKALLLSPGNAHFEGHLGTLQELPEVEGISDLGRGPSCPSVPPTIRRTEGGKHHR